MQFDIITIFPEIFSSYFSESIIARALKKKIIKIKIWNLRDFTNDKRKTVDDRTYGGGPGMILMLEPIVKAIKKIITGKFKKRKIVVLSAKGKLFDQKMAKQFSKLDQLVLISGHYEGIDERVVKNIADMEVSIGNYVLTGGEVPCMVIVDAVTRLIPGVIKEESLREESFEGEDKEYPQYTRPAIFDISKIKKFPLKKKSKYWKVPDVLLSGNHEEIRKWRQSKR